MKEVKYVLVWGASARHYPQHCGLSHPLQDEDVVQIVKKKVKKNCTSVSYAFSYDEHLISALWSLSLVDVCFLCVLI